MVNKKKPERMCIGCMERKPKTELIRIVKSKDGEVSLDKTGKKSGRGAYICNNIECFKKAKKKNAFNRALQIQIDDELYSKIESEL